MSSLQNFSDQELLAEIERLKRSYKNKRYGLSWQSIPEAFDEESENKLPVLQFQSDRSRLTNPNEINHVLIEGENYHALTCLNYTHQEKIDLIYIDPPYNRGSDDFIYKDKRFIDKFPDGTPVKKDNPYRHSYWLSFMSKRLDLSKGLLKKSGFIVVSIDDNEMFNLKLLLDAVFGSDNFVACLPTIMNFKGNQDEFGFAGTHEYTLIYANDKTKADVSEFDIEDDDLSDWLEDDYGLYKEADNLRATGVNAPREKRPNLWYPIFITQTDEIYTTEDNKPKSKTDEVLLPINPEGEELSWYWKKATLKEKTYNLIIKRTKNGTQLYRKQRPKLGDIPTKKPKSVFYKPEYSSSTATTRLKKMFGKKVFNNPKPLELIEDIIRLLCPIDGTVLDYFAGSGTTGHAVLRLNKLGANRKAIIATNNEGGIMDEVCYPRIIKVMDGYELDSPMIENLAFYKCAFIGENPITTTNDDDVIELAKNAGGLLGLAEDTHIEDVATDFYQVFKGKDKYTAVYFREELSEFSKFADLVSRLDMPVIAYVFSWGVANVEDLDGIENVTVKSIPKPILEIFKSVYNLEVS